MTLVYLTEKELKIKQKKMEAELCKLRVDTLLRMGLVYLFSLFEGYVKDFILKLLLNIPEIMKSKKKALTNEQLLKFDSIDGLHLYLANIEVQDFGYKNIDEMDEHFMKLFGFSLKPGVNEWEAFREQYYRRNIQVHNAGKVSDIYIKKLGIEQDNLGVKLPIDMEYIRDCWGHITQCTEYIKIKILEKFKLI